MPCTACGSSSGNKKTFDLNKSRKTKTQKIVYLTPQQIMAIRARQSATRRTLIFT
jgi:ribosomal protein L15E